MFKFLEETQANHYHSKFIHNVISEARNKLAEAKTKLDEYYIDQKAYSRIKEAIIKDVQEKQRNFIANKLDEARKLELKAKTDFDRDLKRKGDSLNYMRLQNKYNSMTGEEVNKAIENYQRGDILEYDDYYLFKKNVLDKADNVMQKSFLETSKNKKNESFHLHFTEDGKKSNDINKFYSHFHNKDKNFDHIPIINASKDNEFSVDFLTIDEVLTDD